MNFGIISLGNHAFNRVIPGIIAAGGKISVIYTRSKENGKRIAEKVGAEYVESFEEALKRDFDAVYISSPNFLHFVQSKKSLEAGKHVLLEKPVTLDVSETEELARISKEKRLRFNIGFHLRFHPAFQDVRKAISDGEIGNIKFAWGKFSGISSRTRGTWWSDPMQVGGGAIAGRGVHVMDSFVYLFGREVEGLGAWNMPKCSVIEDTMLTTLKFKNGIIANALSSSVMTGTSNDLFISGDEGDILVTNAYDTKVDSRLLIKGKIVKEYKGNVDMYEKEIVGFMNEDDNLATGEDAILSTKMHLYSQKSACEGKVYSL